MSEETDTISQLCSEIEQLENNKKEDWEEIEQLRDENDKLRDQLNSGGIHTLMMCRMCSRGVRPRYAIKGMCDECARKALSEAWEMLGSDATDCFGFFKDT